MLQENTPSLYTERLFLRKFTVSDIPALFRMLQRDNRQNRLQTLEGTAGKNRKNSIRARCRNEDLLKRAFFCRRKLRGIFY